MITIRKINSTEVEKLQQISRQTFYETFAENNSAENMNKYLEDNLSIDRLASELSDPSSSFYFAEKDNEVIGYLKLNTADAQTELVNKNALEIERIYVIKNFQGLKIGQLLFDHAIKVAREINAEYVWLGVWEHNTKAINFYKKNGFEEFDRHKFILGDDEQTDVMMKLPLSNDQ